MSSDFLLEPGDRGAQAETQAEPFIAVSPEAEAHLVAVYQEERFEVGGGASALAYALSRNGGRTWSEGLFPNLTPVTGGRFPRATDPWVAFGPGGRVYASALGFLGPSFPDSSVLVFSSADGGESWSDPVVVHRSSPDFSDKPAMVVDAQDDSPYAGRVYVSWFEATGGNHRLLVSHSTNEGASFTRPVAVLTPGYTVGSVPLVGPGGVVHLIWAHLDVDPATRMLFNPKILSARSDDGGVTWSAPVEVAKMTVGRVPDFRSGELVPAAAVDGRNGTLYVVWQDGQFTDPLVPQVVLSVSTDGGATWSEPRLVSDGPLNAPNFTPSVAVNGDGVVGIAYTSLRNDRSRRSFFDEYIAFSKNGGKTFGRSLRLSSLSSDAGALAQTAGSFFPGDYQGLAAGAKTFYRAWVATLFPSRADRSVRQSDVFTQSIRP